MLGKASEIKTAVKSDWANIIQGDINRWLAENQNTIIVDIKFNTIFCSDDNRSWCHALIIYKEAE